MLYNINNLFYILYFIIKMIFIALQTFDTPYIEVLVDGGSLQISFYTLPEPN